MVEQEFLINESVMERFGRLNQSGRLAHAYLFVGPKDVGKGQTALALAKLLNCEKADKNNPGWFCDACPTCLRIGQRQHPDVHVLEDTEEGTLKIEQVRELCNQMKLRPYMAQKKVFIIHRAENLTIEAGNSLLKNLEEPSPNTLIILTTPVLRNVLATIRSRCQIVYFASMPRKGLFDYLTKKERLSSLESQFLAAFSQGVLKRAKDFHESKFLDLKNQVVDSYIFAPDCSIFINDITKDKPKMRVFLDILLSWVHDAFLLKLGVSKERITHIDRLKELENFQRVFSLEQLDALYQQVIQAKKTFEENLNVKMSLLIIKEMLSHGKNS